MQTKCWKILDIAQTGSRARQNIKTRTLARPTISSIDSTNKAQIHTPFFPLRTIPFLLVLVLHGLETTCVPQPVESKTILACNAWLSLAQKNFTIKEIEHNFIIK